MYRPAGQRLLPVLCRNGKISDHFIRSVSIPFSPSLFSTSTTSERIPNQNPCHFDAASTTFTSSSSSTAAGFDGDETAGGSGREHQWSRSSRPGKTQYLDEQARVLRASLKHVTRLGWTEAAMLAGAREVGVSPSMVGSFSRKEAALVEAQPSNVPTSFKQRAMLIDEIWHATGDYSTDVDWYVKRTVLGGIYSTTELYMLTDALPDFRDTWTFLDGRIRDAFDLKKTVQEAKYIAEAVGAGMGGSLQGLMQQVLKNIGRSS